MIIQRERDNDSETGGLLNRHIYLPTFPFCNRYRFVPSLIDVSHQKQIKGPKPSG